MDGRTARASERLSAEEFARAYMGARVELRDGEVVEMAPVTAWHGRVARKLVVLLERHLAGHPEHGELLIEVGFAIQREPDVVFGPDLSVVRPDMALPETGWIEGAPDLAVEVLSPGDRWRDVIGKATRYLEAGTRVVWIVDPVKRVLTVLESDAPPVVLQPGDTLEGGPVLPGLLLAVGELF